MFNETLQKKLDIIKWLDSEKNGKDMCGGYGYCAFCDKTSPTPCADASEKTDAKAVDPEELKNVDRSLGKKFDYDKVMAKKAKRKSLSFAEKYALSDDVLKQRYEILQRSLINVRKGEPKIKSRISKQCDTYRKEGVTVAKITIIGTSLRLNLPLDPSSPEFLDGKTPHVDTGHKKVYADLPFQFKVNSKLALKRALGLIELIK